MEILAGDAVSATLAPAVTPTVPPTGAPVATSAPVAPPVGEGLESPDVLAWELNDDTGVFVGELEVGVVTVENFWGETTTRGFNGQVRRR